MLFVHFLVLNPLTNQVLFMGEFFYQSEKILKRHLRVSMKIWGWFPHCTKGWNWSWFCTKIYPGSAINGPLRGNFSPELSWQGPLQFDHFLQNPLLRPFIGTAAEMCKCVEKKHPYHSQVGSALSLANMTNAGEVVVNKGPPLRVSQTLQHGGDCQQFLFWFWQSDFICQFFFGFWQSDFIAEPVTTVSFDGITARVVRGDLECTNGYIHLLDRLNQQSICYPHNYRPDFCISPHIGGVSQSLWKGKS